MAKQFYRVNITAEMWEAAQKRTEALKTLRSHFRPEWRDQNHRIGMLGEQVAQHFMYRGNPPKQVDTRHYDIDFYGTYVEVKSTLSKAAHGGCHAVIPDGQNGNQNCQLYVFVIVDKSWDFGTVMGFIGKSRWDAEATFHKDGEEQRPGFEYTTDTWALPVKRLHDASKLTEQYDKKMLVALD